MIHVPASNLCFCITHSSRDSDVVAPYEKWEYFDPRVRQVEQDRNYAMNKTKKVINFFFTLRNNSFSNLRLPGLSPTAQLATIDCNSLMSCRSTSRLIFTVHAAISSARERLLTNASTSSIAITNFISHSRTLIVAITSRRSFLLMDFREPLCR